MQQQHAKRGTYLSALQNFFLNPVQGKTCLGSNWNGLRKFKCLSVGPQDIHMSVMKYINTYIQNSDKFTHTHAHTHTRVAHTRVAHTCKWAQQMYFIIPIGMHSAFSPSPFILFRMLKRWRSVLLQLFAPSHAPDYYPPLDTVWL